MEDWNNTDLIKLYRGVKTLQEAIKTGSSIAKAAALEAVREDVKRVSQHPYVHAASREEPSFLPPNALGPARELYREVSVLQALHADADGDNSDAKLQAKERLRQKANALTRALDTEYLPPRFDVPSVPRRGKKSLSFGSVLFVDANVTSNIKQTICFRSIPKAKSIARRMTPREMKSRKWLLRGL